MTTDYINFKYQPFDYTLSGNENHYTIGATLVYSGIKTHHTAGGKNTSLHAGYNASSFELCIKTNSGTVWRLVDNTAGTFLINSSGNYGFNVNTKTYSQWAASYPYFMHIGPKGNINSIIFRSNNTPVFNSNYSLSWFAGYTNVFSHHFAFSYDYPLDEESVLFPVHYIWNGNNHSVPSVKFITFYSHNTSHVSSSSDRYYDWNEKLKSTGYSKNTTIYMYALELGQSNYFDLLGPITYNFTSVLLSSPPSTLNLTYHETDDNTTNESNSVDLSLSLYDLCLNYTGTVPSSATISHTKHWNHIFYFKPIVDESSSATSITDISYCIDFTNVPYLNYSSFKLSGDDLHVGYSNYPQIKYQLMIDHIYKKYGNLLSLSLIKNKNEIINHIEDCDIELNRTLISKLRDKFGAMDPSYNTPTSSNTNHICKYLSDRFLSISNSDSTRKSNMEDKFKNYLNRIGTHKNNWIPFQFEEGDKIHFTYAYNIPGINDQNFYSVTFDLIDDPSSNSCVYHDLSGETTLSISTSDGKYYLDNDNTNIDLQKYYVGINTTILFKNVDQNYPIAFLNHGKENAITYEGDSSKLSYAQVYGDDISYSFYYGDISLNITEEFDILSFTSKNNDYMGGYQKIYFSV